MTCLKDFVAGVCLSEGQTPIPHPLLHTVYAYNSILIHTGNGGKRLEPEKVRVTQSWVENIMQHDWLTVSPVYKLW